MPSAFPDFGASPADSIASQVRDLGEVVNRLKNGFGSLYRGGNWLFATGFEDGIVEVTSGATGSGGAVAARTTYPIFQGKGAVTLTPGAAAASYAYINKTIAPVTTGKIGFEISFGSAFFTVGSIADFDLSMYRILDGAKLEGKVRIHATYNTALELQYLNSSGTYTKIADLPSGFMQDQLDLIHTVKLVIDPDSGKYNKFYFDGVLYDLSGIDLRSTASTVPALAAEFRVIRQNVTGSPQAVADNFIMTQNED